VWRGVAIGPDEDAVDYGAAAVRVVDGEFVEASRKEEGEEYEYVSYKHSGKGGKEEAHTEPALLFQPLGESAGTGSEEESSRQGFRIDVAGGCPSTKDPCYKDVHGGHGKRNQGGTGPCRSGGPRKNGKCQPGKPSGSDGCAEVFGAAGGLAGAAVGTAAGGVGGGLVGGAIGGEAGSKACG
jgi:hypothetical protein